MVKKILAYSSIYIVALALFLVFLVPAAFVWEQVAPKGALKKLGVRVEQVQGRLWEGQALVSYQGLQTIVDWDLHTAGLSSLSLPLDLSLNSHVGTAKARAELGMGGIELNVERLDADLATLNRIAARKRVKLSGDLMIRGLSAQLTGDKVVNAEGKFSWTGGDISYPAGRQTRERTVVPMQGVVQTRDDGQIYLGIKDSGGAFDLIEGTLSREGEAFLQVKRRLLDLVDEPWSSKSTETDTVFKVKKVLY